MYLTNDKKYLVVNCQKGIAVILMETKELVSYYKHNVFYKSKTKIFYDDEKYFYILYIDSMKMKRFSIIYGDLEVNKKWPIFNVKTNISAYSISNIGENPLLRFGESIYIWDNNSNIKVDEDEFMSESDEDLKKKFSEE